MAPESDDSDLRARVAELEATVEAQQETIRKMLPGRRQVLHAGGLLAGGGVLGALTADRASADVVGQVGTSQDRVDVFGGEVDANSVNTEKVATTRTWEDVAGSRSFDTWYQNSTGTDIELSVAVRTLTDTDETRALLYVSGSQSENTSNIRGDLYNTDPSTTDTRSTSVTVPDGDYYQLAASIGTPGTSIEIQYWSELS